MSDGERVRCGAAWLLVLLTSGVAAGTAHGRAVGSSELVRFIGDYLRLRHARSVVLYQSSTSDRFSSRSVAAIIHNFKNQQNANLYFASCQNVSMKTPMQELNKLLEGSSHGSDTFNIILSDDEASFDFMDKVNASGMFGLSDEQHQWLVLSDRGNVVQRWRRRYLPVNNHVTIAEIWRSSDSGSESESESRLVSQVDLAELYHLAPGLPAQQASLGRWTPQTGAQSWDGRSIYERRRDWSGLALRVGVTQGLPLTLYLPPPVSDVGGYMGSVWKFLADILKFNYTVTPSVDGEWGGLNEAGQWTGVVGMLLRRDIDVAVGHLSVTEARSQVIDFTERLLVLDYRLFIKKPSALDLSWKTYLDSFDSQLWVILCMTIVFGSAGMATMYLVERRWLATGRSQGNYGLIDTLLHFFGIACQQGVEDTPRGLGTRFFFWVFFLTMVIAHAAYSATLVSFLAVQSLVLPFQSLEGLLGDGTYKLGVNNGTSMYDFFQFSKSPTNAEIFKKHIVGLRGDEEGWKRIKIEKMALFAWSENEASCDTVKLNHEYFKHDVAFGLQKHSPYKKFFDYHLVRLIEGGVMDHVLIRQLGRPQSCDDRQMQGLGLPNLVSAFAMLAGGHLLSLLIMAAEIVWSRVAAARRHSRSPRQRQEVVGILRLGNAQDDEKMLTGRAAWKFTQHPTDFALTRVEDSTR